MRSAVAGRRRAPAACGCRGSPRRPVRVREHRDECVAVGGARRRPRVLPPPAASQALAEQGTVLGERYAHGIPQHRAPVGPFAPPAQASVPSSGAQPRGRRRARQGAGPTPAVGLSPAGGAAPIKIGRFCRAGRGTRYAVRSGHRSRDLVHRSRGERPGGTRMVPLSPEMIIPSVACAAPRRLPADRHGGACGDFPQRGPEPGLVEQRWVGACRRSPAAPAARGAAPPGGLRRQP